MTRREQEAVVADGHVVEQHLDCQKPPEDVVRDTVAAKEGLRVVAAGKFARNAI